MMILETDSFERDLSKRGLNLDFREHDPSLKYLVFNCGLGPCFDLREPEI